MNIYQKIIRRFPRGIVYSFAYGSGVKQQVGYERISKQKSNVIDLAFCVDNPDKWHAENLEKHSSHYSGFRILGSQFIASYQDKLAAKVYFNTLVPLTDIGVTIKYGIISKEHLLNDLNDWTHLYFAGRLHKPVNQVVAPDDSLQKALQQNLQSAFLVALLMLPENFTDFELFHTISNISYSGDFRMIFGENKNKVQNIVRPQLEEFFELYQPVLRSLSPYVAVGKEKTKNEIFFEQDKSVKATQHHLKLLPSHMQERIRRNSVVKGSYMEVVQSISTSGNTHDVISMSLTDIVWRSSLKQSIKNIPSAGISKSLTMSDSDSSNKRRSEKKHKKKEKKHKKDKKHKHKKRSHKISDSEASIQDDYPLKKKIPEDVTIPRFLTNENPEVTDEAFGPALPPHLLAGKTPENTKEEPAVIGPSLPAGIVLQTDHESDQKSEDEEDAEELFGPLPTDCKSFAKMTTAQIKLEERALEMRLAMLDPDANKEDINKREEWMLELPDVGLKTGLASLKRTFHTKERPDFSDRSSWTKTPNSSDAPTTSKVTETTKSKAEKKYQEQRDAEQEKIAKKLKKKHKRDESLYEIHQKKLKKDKKEKEVNGKSERRPFSRDVDLQLNKIDKNQTKKIVDKAKFLDSRFSSGNAKYL
ncbi:uncharacterized protein LOC129918945 [Episyrphus balteatus]|uniref:uncharacterized protein LOC129918945 n=1 Tax=Episyrphus balteatus TaxID=286459 RepID=UPI002484E387|nr:uncharacterized protein LOC129918945 [Episyrphus balteatus]